MKFSFAIFLVVILGTVFVVRALKCYSCAGSNTSDCYNGKKSSMVIQTCPNLPSSSFHSYVLGSYTGSAFQEVCISLVQTNTVPEMYARGCGVFPRTDDPCDFLKKHFPVSSCKYCRTDLCEDSEQQIEFNDVSMI